MQKMSTSEYSVGMDRSQSYVVMAHDFACRADDAYRDGDLSASVDLHNKAAEGFEAALGSSCAESQTGDAFKLLAESHRRKATRLRQQRTGVAESRAHAIGDARRADIQSKTSHNDTTHMLGKSRTSPPKSKLDVCDKFIDTCVRLVSELDISDNGLQGTDTSRMMGSIFIPSGKSKGSRAGLRGSMMTGCISDIGPPLLCSVLEEVPSPTPSPNRRVKDKDDATSPAPDASELAHMIKEFKALFQTAVNTYKAESASYTNLNSPLKSSCSPPKPSLLESYMMNEESAWMDDGVVEEESVADLKQSEKEHREQLEQARKLIEKQKNTIREWEQRWESLEIKARAKRRQNAESSQHIIRDVVESPGGN